MSKFSNELTSQGTPRLIAPDVARGLALLGISAANATTAWFTNTEMDQAAMFGGISEAHPALDKVVALLAALFVHNRGLPMFSTLLGVGVGFIALSLWRRGYPLAAARGRLIRRYLFLALFGAIHMVFLFYGDIMLFYGFAGVLLACMLGWKDSTLLKVAYWLLGAVCTVGILVAAIMAFLVTDPAIAEGVAQSMNPSASMEGMPGAEMPNTYPGLVLFQALMLLFTLFSLPFIGLTYMPLMMIGFVWARQGRMANVAQYRKSFQTWAAIGIAVMILVGLPWGLSAIGVLPARLEAVFAIMNFSVGILTGPAILAIFVLLLDAVPHPAPLWLRVPAALGKRSMSGYLFQSVVYLILVSPFALNVGHNTGAAVQLGIAFAIWAASLALAWALEMANKPGPFEWLHRRLSYPTSSSPQPLPRA